MWRNAKKVLADEYQSHLMILTHENKLVYLPVSTRLPQESTNCSYHCIYQICY